MIIHDNSIKKIVEHRKNELSENIDTYVLKLYLNIGTYTIFEFHYVHTDNISVYISISISIYLYIYLALCWICFAQSADFVREQAHIRGAERFLLNAPFREPSYNSLTECVLGTKVSVYINDLQIIENTKDKISWNF